jgi:hypothetical protein
LDFLLHTKQLSRAETVQKVEEDRLPDELAAHRIADGFVLISLRVRNELKSLHKKESIYSMDSLILRLFRVVKIKAWRRNLLAMRKDYTAFFAFLVYSKMNGELEKALFDSSSFGNSLMDCD